MIGETYNRMLLGDAILAEDHPLYLPMDFKFHGEEAHYLIDGYFGAPMYASPGPSLALRELPVTVLFTRSIFAFGKDEELVIVESRHDHSSPDTDAASILPEEI